jgi:glycosyltransferase involved in cell wall biosynthesis
MRIAFIGLRAIGSPAAGGIEKAIEELSTRLAARGHDVTVFTRARYDSQVGGEYRGVRLKRLPAIYTKHLEAISSTAISVLHALHGFDVVHVNATGPALLAFLPRIFGRRVVVTVHGLDWQREKWGGFAKFWLKFGAWAAAAFPDCTTVVSQTLLAHYRERGRGRVVYIPNGVNLPDEASIRRLPNPLGLEFGSYVLFLSRLVPEKGCHTLIRAFKGVETSKKLVIVGPPSHSDAYAAELVRLAAGDERIIFAGARFGAEKDVLFRDAALFVLPSTIEGMALVLLEAMSFGKACLCSDIPENLEVVQSNGIAGPGIVGATFKVGDATDLRQQLEALLRNTPRAQELGQLARNHVASTFDWDRIALQYERVYEDIA